MTIRPRAAATAEALDALPKTFTVSRAAAGSSYATSSDEVDLDASGSSSRALDLHDSGAQRSADASGSEYRGVFCNYFSIGARAAQASRRPGQRVALTEPPPRPLLLGGRRGQQDRPRLPQQAGGGAGEVHLPVPKPPLVCVVWVQGGRRLLLAGCASRRKHRKGAAAAAIVRCVRALPFSHQ